MTMLSRGLYRKIIGGVASLALLSLAGSWLLITGASYFLSIVCLLLILLITVLMIRRINTMNRQMAVFFESVRNGDTASRYPEAGDDPFTRAAYREMNRILALFNRQKNTLEEERLYYEGILRVMTHEIRNTITPIRSLSADLARYADTYTPEEAREGLRVIHEQADNLATFLDAYHRLTHLPEPEPVETRVASLFRKIARLIGAEPGSERIRFAASDDCVVRADAHLLTLALINLIRNAAQAIEGQADGAIAVEAERRGDRLDITIADNGPGIPPERLSAIFTPFYSTKPGGSGIGLSIAQRVMRLHGGDLTVESRPGRTLFRMRF